MLVSHDCKNSVKKAFREEKKKSTSSHTFLARATAERSKLQQEHGDAERGSFFCESSEMMDRGKENWD